MLVTRPTPTVADLIRTVDAAVGGGVDRVQLRDKESAWEEVARVARAVRDVIAGRALLFVNHPEWRRLAAVADGVHLPEAGPSVAEVRREVGADALVGRSIHSVATALGAETVGASYLVAGTLFSSASHPDRPPAGLAWLHEVCRATSIAILAIGGVTPSNAMECVRAGAAGVAVLSPLMDAADPRAVAATYRSALREAMDQGCGELRMRLTVNGKDREIDTSMTLAAYLASLGLRERMIVVERNGAIVQRDAYARTTLEDGDVLEIVQMMAGG